MPSEPAGLPGIYICSHGPRPVRPGDAVKSSHHGVHDVRKPVAPLQGVAAVARGARDLRQLAASLAMYGWQVVRVARHLAGLAQAACNLFSFLCIHEYILSNKIPYIVYFLYMSTANNFAGLLLAACRLGLGAGRLASRCCLRCTQYGWTVPLMSGAGP